MYGLELSSNLQNRWLKSETQFAAIGVKKPKSEGEIERSRNSGEAENRFHSNIIGFRSGKIVYFLKRRESENSM